MNKFSRPIISFIVFCILAAAILLTLLLNSSPKAISANAPAEVFSAERAMQDLEIIARQPHPMGISQTHTDVRNYLLGEIQALGLDPHVQDTFGVRIVEPGFVTGGSVQNILVRLSGTNPEGAIVLISHYDTTPANPGAGCSSSGVVTILEILRALKAGPPLRHDVIILFTDGEEPGTVGAHAFVAQHPWFNDIKLVINLDQFWIGPPYLLGTSGGNGLWIDALAHSTSLIKPAYLSLPYHLFPSGETDLLPFFLAGVPGVDIRTSAQTPESHTAAELPGVVDPGSIQQGGNQMLALVRYLGNQPELEKSLPDQTFFPLLGMLVHYPTRLALPLGIAAGLCFLGTLGYGFGSKRLTWRGLGLGFLAFLLNIALIEGIVTLLWLGIQTLHPEYGYNSFRAHMSDDFLYAVAFIVLGVAITTATIALVRKKITSLDLAAGVLVFWFLGTLAVSVLLPATSYLTTWVLLAGALSLVLAIVVQPKQNSWSLSSLAFLCSAILGTFLWVPVIFNAFLGSSFPMVWVVIGAAAVWLGSIFPALDLIASPKRSLIPIAASLIALGFLVMGHIQVGKDSPPPWINPIGYWLNADGETAYWVTFSEEFDERQTNLIDEPVWHPYPELISVAPPYPVLTSVAPILDLDGPRLEILQDEWGKDCREVKARIRTSLINRLYIFIRGESPLLSITVPYNEKTELPLLQDGDWMLRFDGMPEEGIEISFEFSETGPIQFLLVDEMTGLPHISGLSTQPQPGTMKSPGVLFRGNGCRQRHLIQSREVGDEITRALIDGSYSTGFVAASSDVEVDLTVTGASDITVS